MIAMIELIYKLIICHFIGDYVLQTDFIVKSKGSNLYHMIVHCMLYSVPFAYMFGFDRKLMLIIVSHVIIDLAKARWQKIGYIEDQVLHFMMLTIYLLLMYLI